jgi:RecB family exonuclease
VREQGLVKFLIAVLQAELEDWSFQRLLAVFDSSYFQPRGVDFNVAASARAVSLALRRLQLPGNRAAILDAVQRVAARTPLPKDERDPDDAQPLEDLARLALPLLRWYAAHTEPLRRSHSLGDWFDVLAGIVSQWTNHGPRTADATLWDDLQRRLREAANAEAKVSEQPLRLTVTQFLAEFRDLIADERLQPRDEDPGSVRVLSFDQLRHVSVPHLFLAGMTEDSFPQRRSDDCLFSDAERERLADRGVSLQHHARHQQEEMLFFQLLLHRAGRRLTISYPEVDQHGQPVFCSPYVVALRSVFTPQSLPILPPEGQLDPIPPAEQALSLEDVRLVAMDEALSGRAGWLRTLAESPAQRATIANLRGAVEMALHRFQTPGFTVYEGRLESPQHQRALADRFSPQRQFSATELEGYAKCPFRYWLESVLKVEALEEPTEDPDRRRRGLLVHDVVARLLEPMSAGMASHELAEQFRALVAERLERELKVNELQRALSRIEQQLLDEWANAYAQQVSDYALVVREAGGESWSSAAPEMPFGDAPRARQDDGRAAYPPLEVGSAERRVLVRGRIDRVDLGRSSDGRPVFSVIDYKTGAKPKFTVQEVESGRALQLALYTLAVQRLGIAPADATPFQLGYWCLSQTGFAAGPGPRAKKSALDAAVWQTLVDVLERIIPQLAAGIRAGEFVVENSDQKCTGSCSFHTVCRVNQVRSVALARLKRRNRFELAPETPR